MLKTYPNQVKGNLDLTLYAERRNQKKFPYLPYCHMIWQENLRSPDPPSRHHLPFDKLTALSKVEGSASLLGAVSLSNGI